jgi:hypothetical protein
VLEFYDPCEHEMDVPSANFMQAVAIMQRVIEDTGLMVRANMNQFIKELGAALTPNEFTVFNSISKQMVEDKLLQLKPMMEQMNKIHSIISTAPPTAGPRFDRFAKRGKGVRRK